MATLVKPARKGYSIQWYKPGGARETLYLGRIQKGHAETFLHHVERLIESKSFDEPPPVKTLRWAAKLETKWRDKLAEKGLYEGVRINTLDELVANFRTAAIDRGLAPATIEKIDLAAANLVARIKGATRVASVTAADAEDHAAWIKSGGKRKGGSLASSSAGKQIQTCSAIFRRAVQLKVIDDNPFAGLGRPPADSDAQVYVAVNVVLKVMERCDPALRFRVAMSRFAGLRQPSEMNAMELQWVQLEERRMLVFSPKNQRFEHKRWREVPIQPALAPYVAEEIERAREGQTYLADSFREITATAWRNRLERACTRAGVVPWPVLWHSMRGSCGTDWLDEGFPEHVVCRWMNCSPKELRRSYAKTTDDHLAKAAGLRSPEQSTTAERRRRDRVDALVSGPKQMRLYGI
jgi:site-specific recombinase XerD